MSVIGVLGLVLAIYCISSIVVMAVFFMKAAIVIGQQVGEQEAIARFRRYGRRAIAQHAFEDMSSHLWMRAYLLPFLSIIALLVLPPEE